MKQFKLKNGLTVIFEPRSADTVSIEISVGVGSNIESKNIAGISHFLEHMMFEGTKTRSSKEIGETIENIGGELNAATSNERTFYYTKVPKKHFLLALELLSDIIKNPIFDSKALEKERNVVLEEIKMTTDQPLYYQWILFEANLFKKHPAKNPIYGSFKTVKSITRTDILSFFNKWYCPNNMIITIVGNVNNPLKQIKEFFGDMKKVPLSRPKKIIEPPSKKPKIARKHRQIQNAYVVLGYKAPSRKHPDSYVLDVISAIFYKGLSGRIVEEIRNKRGLVYSVGCAYDSNKEYGIFAFYLNTKKTSTLLCRDIILQEISNLNTVSPLELKQTKEYIEGKHIVSLEDTQKKADQLSFWTFIGDPALSKTYLKNIKKVTKDDILRVSKKYLNKNYTMTILEGP